MSESDSMSRSHRRRQGRRKKPSSAFRNPYESPVYAFGSPRSDAGSHSRGSRAKSEHRARRRPSRPQTTKESQVRFPSPYRQGTGSSHHPQQTSHSNTNRPLTTGTARLPASSHQTNGHANGASGQNGHARPLTNGGGTTVTFEDDPNIHTYSTYAESPEATASTNRMLRRQLHRSLLTEQSMRTTLSDYEQANARLMTEVKRLRNLHHAEETEGTKQSRAKIHDMHQALEASEQRELIALRDLKNEKAMRRNDLKMQKEKYQQRLADVQRRLGYKTEQVKQLQREKEEQEVEIRELQSIIRAKNTRLQELSANQKEKTSPGHPKKKALPVYISSSEEEDEDVEPQETAQPESKAQTEPRPSAMASGGSPRENRNQSEPRAVRFSTDDDARENTGNQGQGKGKNKNKGKASVPGTNASGKAGSTASPRGSSSRAASSAQESSPSGPRQDSGLSGKPTGSASAARSASDGTRSGQPKPTTSPPQTTGTRASARGEPSTGHETRAPPSKGTDPPSPAGTPSGTKGGTSRTPNEKKPATSTSTHSPREQQGRVAREESNTGTAGSGKSKSGPSAEQATSSLRATSSTTKAGSQQAKASPASKETRATTRDEKSTAATTSTSASKSTPVKSAGGKGAGGGTPSSSSKDGGTALGSSTRPGRTRSDNKLASSSSSTTALSSSSRAGKKTGGGNSSYKLQKAGTGSASSSSSKATKKAAVTTPKASPQKPYEPDEIAAIMIQSAYRGWATRKTFEQTSREPQNPALSFVWHFHQQQLELWAHVYSLAPRPALFAQLDQFVALQDSSWERDLVGAGSTTPDPNQRSRQTLHVYGKGDPSIVLAGYVRHITTLVPAPRRLLVIYHTVGADPICHNNPRWILQRLCATLVEELDSNKAIPRDLGELKFFFAQLLRAASLVTRVLLVIDRCDRVGHEFLASDLHPSALPDNVKMVFAAEQPADAMRHVLPRPQELEIASLSPTETSQALERIYGDDVALDSPDLSDSCPLYIYLCRQHYGQNDSQAGPPSLSQLTTDVVSQVPGALQALRAIEAVGSPLPLSAIQAVMQSATTAGASASASTWSLPDSLLTANGGPLAVIDSSTHGNGTWVCVTHPVWFNVLVDSSDDLTALTDWALISLTGAGTERTSSRKTARRPWDGVDPGCGVALRDLPRLLQRSGADPQLAVCDLDYLVRRCAGGTAYELAQDLHHIGAVTAMPEILALIEANTALLEDSPHTLIQEAANLTSSSSQLATQARQLLTRSGNTTSWLELAFENTSRRLLTTCAGAPASQATFALLGLVNEQGRALARINLNDLSQDPEPLSDAQAQADIAMSSVAYIPPFHDNGSAFIAGGTADGRVIIYNAQDKMMIESVSLPKSKPVTAMSYDSPYLFACCDGFVHILAIHRAEWKVIESLSVVQHTRRLQGVLGPVLVLRPMRIELIEANEDEGQVSCTGLAYMVAVTDEGGLELVQIQLSGDDRWSLIRMSVCPALEHQPSPADTFALSDTATQFAMVSGKGSRVLVWNTQVQHLQYTAYDEWDPLPTIEASCSIQAVQWTARNRLTTADVQGNVMSWNTANGRAAKTWATRRVITALWHLGNGNIILGGPGAKVSFVREQDGTESPVASPPTRPGHNVKHSLGRETLRRASTAAESLSGLQVGLFDVSGIAHFLSAPGAGPSSFIAITKAKEAICYHDAKETGRFILEVEQSLSDTHKIAVSPDGQFVLRCSVDGAVSLSSHGATPLELGAHSDTITSASFSPNGQYALTSGHDNCVHIYDVMGACLWRTHKAEHPILHAEFSLDSAAIAYVSGFDNSLALFDLGTGVVRRPQAPLSPLKGRADQSDVSTLAQIRLRRFGVLPTRVAFLGPSTSNGASGAGYVVVGHRSGSCVLSDVGSLRQVHQWMAHSAAVTGIWASDNLVITCGRDSLLKAWRITCADGQCSVHERASVHAGGAVTSMAVSTNSADAAPDRGHGGKGKGKEHVCSNDHVATVILTTESKQARVYYVHIPQNEGEMSNDHALLPPDVPARLIAGQ